MGFSLSIVGATALKPTLFAASSTTILAAGGLSTIGTAGGAIGGFAGLVGTYIALRANARTARREYQQEMDAAEKRGRDSMRDSMQPVIDNQTQQIANLTDSLNVSRQAERDARRSSEYWMQQATGRGPDRAPPS